MNSQNSRDPAACATSHATSPTGWAPGWLYVCRPGYESVLASEVQQAARERGVSGYCRARSGSGRVSFHRQTGGAGEVTHGTGAASEAPELTFARAGGDLIGELQDLPTDARAEAIMAALPPNAAFHGEPRVDAPDTAEGRRLATFCRRFRGALRRALAKRARADGDELWCLFPDSGRVFLARRTPGLWPLDWPAGVPRLKRSKAAPSRSALKLEEALHRLVPEALQPRRDQHAVDLGAAPGGWTWVLRRRGLRVTAVDPQRLKGELPEDPWVEHLRADAFRYVPERPVDWLVCDLVERPQRVGPLVQRWLAQGWCRHAVFNLKLPMERPLDVVQRTRQELAGLGARHITVAQLYHDRDEVTLFAALHAGR